MPGCSPFVLFPRVKAYTQVNVMWDMRGNQAFQNRPTSPNPPLPIPSGGFMRQDGDRSAFPFPFAPIGVPAASPHTHRSRSQPRATPTPSPPEIKQVDGYLNAGAHTAREPSHQSRQVHQHTHLSTHQTHHTHPSHHSHTLPSRTHHNYQSTHTHQIKHHHSSSEHLPHRTTNYSHNHSKTQLVTEKPNRPPLATAVVSPPLKPQQPAQVPRPIVQYSKCSGRKKALCIGINYIGQSRALHGCINDALDVKKFLVDQWGYKSGDIVVLIDNTDIARQMPTRKNILDAMAWLVRDAQPHDALFFHYSGHGGQTPDLDGDETDGLDEVIYPVDYRKSSFIVDDEMHRIMVKSLPPNCRLTAVFDSCHSGTALDLPYIYHSNGRLRGQHVSARALTSKATLADVISWCGCRDDQTSADTQVQVLQNHKDIERAVGAMSWAFIESLTKNRNQSYKELLQSIRRLLRDKYSQKPQLSSSHRIDTNLRFIM